MRTEYLSPTYELYVIQYHSISPSLHFSWVHFPLCALPDTQKSNGFLFLVLSQLKENGVTSVKMLTLYLSFRFLFLFLFLALSLSLSLSISVLSISVCWCTAHTKDEMLRVFLLARSTLHTSLGLEWWLCRLSTCHALRHVSCYLLRVCHNDVGWSKQDTYTHIHTFSSKASSRWVEAEWICSKCIHGWFHKYSFDCYVS